MDHPGLNVGEQESSDDKHKSNNDQCASLLDYITSLEEEQDDTENNDVLFLHFNGFKIILIQKTFQNQTLRPK